MAVDAGSSTSRFRFATELFLRMITLGTDKKIRSPISGHDLFFAGLANASARSANSGMTASALVEVPSDTISPIAVALRARCSSRYATTDQVADNGKT
jgi:hypothetical protein